MAGIDDLRIDLRTYPPAGHGPRVAGYEKHQQLFDGDHRRRFKIVAKPNQSIRYLIANLPQMISTFAADLLFGEPPDFLAPHENEAEQAKNQEWLNDCVQRNALHITNHETALGCSFRGDAVLKVRWGVRDKSDEEAVPEAIIESVEPDIYFPELAPDNTRDVLSATLAWQKVIKQGETTRTYIRVEQHTPGFIRNRLFLRTQAPRPIEVPLTALPEYAGLPPVVETGVKGLLVIHVPNTREGTRFWGISDYQSLESVFEAINNRLTQIDVVLDKHVAPKLLVPPGLINADGTIRLDELEAVELDRGDQPPSYVTWDAHLVAAYTQLDRLLELIFIVAEIPPCALGIDKYGVAESGRALRLRMMRALAKVNRKRNYFDLALKKALLLAQELANAHGNAGLTPMEPNIQWADGLPEDTVEAVDIEEKRRSAGNTSIESSIRRLDGPDAVEAEVQRIQDEDTDAAALTGAAGRKGKPAIPFKSAEDDEDEDED